MTDPAASARSSALPAITVRKCTALAEFQECVRLQREIWDETDLEIEPATMFVVAAHTGGQVLGAFDADRLVGYTLAVVGLLTHAISSFPPHRRPVRISRSRRRPHVEALSARRSPGTRHPSGPVDLRSTRIAQRTLQLEPPRRHRPHIPRQSLRRHHQSASSRPGDGSSCGRMASGFAEGRRRNCEIVNDPA